MSDVVAHKRTMRRRGRLRWFNSDPKRILFRPGRGGSIEFADGGVGVATCLGCHDAPCMELSESELIVGGELQSFPGNPSRDVCPSDAISWDDAGEVPTIDDTQCIGCGLCAVRCPYGAIAMRGDGVAVVEGTDPDGITHTRNTSVGPHVVTPRVGLLDAPTAAFMREMPDVIGELRDTQTTLLARNMLIAAGVTASTRRKGDTNVRMDGVLRTRMGQLGVIEIETGAAALESPRALLEDIAVLRGRFRVPVAAIVPVSLLLALPNVRSEYYRVIDDIQEVLGIQCRTLTLGALSVLLWHFVRIDRLDRALFTKTPDPIDLHASMIRLVSGLSPTEPYPGAYRPLK